MDEPHVVTVFLRNRGDVLLCRRSDEVGSYRGKWGGVAGHGEGDPDAAARTEIAEETGIDPESVSLVRRGDPFPVEDAERGTRWVVHPFLFDCPTRDVSTNRETDEFKWTSPTAILRRDAVPDLWRSYRAVAPSVESVAADAEHGSAYLSVRALEVLCDRAGEVAAADGDWAAVAEVAADLLDARPTMAAVRNRVDRVMDAADAATPAAVETVALVEAVVATPPSGDSGSETPVRRPDSGRYQ